MQEYTTVHMRSQESEKECSFLPALYIVAPRPKIMIDHVRRAIPL